MSKMRVKRIVTDEREGVYKPSGKSVRTTTPSKSGKPQKGGNRRPLPKVRCEICRQWFTPVSKDQLVCSDECRDEKRRRKDRARYKKSVGGVLSGRKYPTKKQQPKTKKKGRYLTHKGQLKQVFASAKEALASLKPKEIENVERIMALPYGERWEAGAKRWTEAQRVLARRIELKRIASDAKLLDEEDNLRDRLNQAAQTDQTQEDKDDYCDNEACDNL